MGEMGRNQRRVLARMGRGGGGRKFKFAIERLREDIPNLTPHELIQALNGLRARGYVKTEWGGKRIGKQVWVLTDSGLRKSEVVRGVRLV